MNNKIKIIIAIGIIGILVMVAGFVMGSGPSSIPAIFSDQNLPEGSAAIPARFPLNSAKTLISPAAVSLMVMF